MLNDRANSLQSCEAKPPPPPPGPASAANLVHRMTFFDSVFDSFFILHFFTYLSQKGGPTKRQKSQNSVKDHSSNLAWKSCLQKGPPKCESYSLQRFKLISKVPRYPEKPPKLDPELLVKLQNVRKLRTPKNYKKSFAGKSSKVPQLYQQGSHFSRR